METLLKIVMSVVELILSFKFCDCYLELKKKVNNRRIVCEIIVLAMVGTVLNSIFINIIVNLSVSIAVIFIILQCYEGNRAKKIFIGTVYIIFSMLLDLITSIGTEILFGSRNIVIEKENAMTFFILTIYYALKFLIIHFLEVTRKKVTQINNRKMYLKQAVIPALSITFVCYFLYIQLKSAKIDYQIFYAVIIIFLVINIMMYVIYENMEKLYISNYNNELLNESLKYRETYYQDVEMHQAEIRRIRHDLKNQLLVIRGELEQADIAQAKKEIDAIIHDIVNTEERCFTGNVAINALLNAKYTEAVKKDIDCRFDIVVPEKLQLSGGDIGILLGNTLDNAIEACEQCDEKRRTIELRMHYYNQYMTIEILNTTKNKVSKLTISKVNAKEHGWGLISVRGVVEKYNGTIRVESKDDSFLLEMTLWNV